MRSSPGYWLDPRANQNEATAELGFYIPGSSERVQAARNTCPHCGTSLKLAAVYQESPYILLEHHTALVLKMCPQCAEESDGYEGRNGYNPEFADEASLDRYLTEMNGLLAAPLYFLAVPTGEPVEPHEFAVWKLGKVRPKLGGRQIAIQRERSLRPCSCCGAPTMFVGSIDERWAPEELNFGGGMGYTFACTNECRADAAFFYWDCP